MIQPSTYYHIYNHANGFENIFKEEQNYCFFLEKYQFYISPIADTLAYCLMPNHFHFLIRVKGVEELRTFSPQTFRTLSSPQTFRKLSGLKAKQTFSPQTFRKLSGLKAKQTFGKLPSLTSSPQTFQKLSGLKAKQTFSPQTFQKLSVLKTKQTFGKLPSSLSDTLISKQFSKLFSCYTQSFNKYYHRMGSLFIPNFKRKEITSQDYLLQLILYIHNNPVKHGFTSTQADWKFSSFKEIAENKEIFVSKQEVISLFENLDNFLYAHHQKENLTNDLMMEE